MKLILKIITFFILLIVLLGIGVFFSLPTEREIRGCLTTKMYAVHLCPGSKDYVQLKNISKHMQRAVILSEDGNFFHHDGFDWESIEKNAKENLKLGEYKRGGSTLTQQLAKNMFLTKDKTLWRKGIEALITFRLEKYLTKKEILERYLNVVEFGKDIYGIKQAASYYFKKSPAELTVVESAFLAMVLPSPTKYSRSYYKKELTPFAKQRIQKIVSDLSRSGLISAEETQQADVQMRGFLGSPPPPPPDSVLEDLDATEESLPPATLEIEKEAIQKLDDTSLDQAPLDSSDGNPPPDDND